VHTGCHSSSIWRSLGAIATTALVASACRSENIVDFEDFSGAVVTLVDSGPALQSARTFALPDTIVEAERSAGSIGHASDQDITAHIRNHFLALGWQEVRVGDGVRPDVLVLVAAATRIQTGVTYGDWYGSWSYLPYWSPAVNSSWVWGAPVGAIPYAFPAGTLLITMLDVRAQREETRSIPLLWAAAIDGVVTNSIDTTERAIVGIDQAFAQSAYLRVPET
jgi:uncharacterized protein DUF4136